MSQNILEASPIGEIQHFCKLMRSKDKNERKFALASFEDKLNLQSDTASCSEKDYHEIFIECHVDLLNTMRDNNEMVRECSIRCISSFLLKKLPSNDFYLAHLLPVVIDRIGTPAVLEKAEEIRNQLLQLIAAILDHYEERHLAPSIAEFVTILQQSVKDRFTVVKHLSCRCIIQLAKRLPAQFHQKAILLHKPLLITLFHAHQKIRIVGIECLVEVIMHGPSQVLTDAVSPLAQKHVDLSPLVRLAVVQGGATLLMKYRDRYSYFYKLLPLLLTGLNDETPSVRKQAQDLWKKVGLQYQHENEKDLKDQLDYLTSTPKNYPEGIERPSLGCRTLVQRSLSKLSLLVCCELASWKSEIRLKCAQLLSVVSLHSEEGIIQHLPEIMQAMYTSGARNPEKYMFDYLIHTAQHIGTFVPADAWAKLIIALLEDGANQYHIKLLSGLVNGASAESLAPVLNKIVGMLASKDVCHSVQPEMQEELVLCCRAIQLKHTNDQPMSVAQNLFNVLVTVASNSQNPNIASEGLLAELQRSLGLSSAHAMWERFLPKLLDRIKSNPCAWHADTVEKAVFQHVLLNSGHAFGTNLTVIGEILVESLQESAEPECRLTLLCTLAEALNDKQVLFSHVDTDSFFKMLFSAVICPTLVWKAGLTAEALRGAAVACVVSVFACRPCSRYFRCPQILQVLTNMVLSALHSLCEDSAERTRLLALEAIQLIKQHMSIHELWTYAHMVYSYPLILKRLNDPVENVRFMAAKVFDTLVDFPPRDFLAPKSCSHMECILDTLFIHYDDPDEDFRKIIHDVLLKLGKINPELTLQIAKKQMEFIHNQAGLKELINYVEVRSTFNIASPKSHSQAEKHS